MGNVKVWYHLLPLSDISNHLVEADILKMMGCVEKKKYIECGY